RTVRFYEEAGLLRPVERGEGGRRMYGEDDLARLELITDLREAGLALKEIKDLLDVKRSCASPRELNGRLAEALQAQIARTEARLTALRRLKKELTESLEAIDVCNHCTRPMDRDACASCDDVVNDRAPRLVKVVLGRKKPCCALTALVRLKRS
ncbi:MAG: MerR family transcriptional regulator, partial [Myxococcales bacterium]